MKDLLWLIPLLPLLGAAGQRPRRQPPRLVAPRHLRASRSPAPGSPCWPAFAAIADWAAHRRHATRRTSTRCSPGSRPASHTTVDGFLANLSIDFALRSTRCRPSMLFFVTFVGFLIHVYSVGYMHGESRRGVRALLRLPEPVHVRHADAGPGRQPRWSCSSAGKASACAPTCSSASTSRRTGAPPPARRRSSSTASATSASSSPSSSPSRSSAPSTSPACRPPSAADPGKAAPWATPIALLLFVGAIGKSAQLPLYVWLPDAMAGPTPVSALIHAATMVTAGVYMVARSQLPLRRSSPTALLVVAVVGGLTAIFAATIGLAQNDIKKVLAYSTVSQLGYMFLARRRRGVRGGDLPRLHPRLLQGLPVPRLRLGDPRLRRRAGHAQDGRPEEAHADHLLDVPGGDAGARRHPALRRVLLQGRDPRQGVRGRGAATCNGLRHGLPRALGPRARRRVPDRVLHVPRWCT